ncbi:MAG: S41 family peptidase [Calditrichaeota bacterium]|nr:MAG: S41 family peptidase [Calditrichota bacterium]
MIKKEHLSRLLVACLACIVFAGWLSHESKAFKIDYLGEVQKNIIYFGKVYQEVTNKYIDVVDPHKLMNIGIDAMLTAVDDYTILIEGEENTQLKILTTGRYGGLGMVIGVRDHWPTVMEPPYDDTPAARAGCREGDRIVRVDGVSTEDMTVNEVAELMRGEIGTAVNIEVSRSGVDEPLEFRLVRAEIIVKDVVFSDLIADSVGYIKLSRFSKNATAEMRQAVIGLKNKGMTGGIIIDLRNNPGGLLEAAVGVADIFLPKGEFIVSTQGRTPETVQRYFSENAPLLPNQNLVLLVNSFSASASEIVAGAIQDLDRGVIVGQPTYGKGLVQSIIEINRDAQLKLTTAKYYLPSGRLIQKDRRTRKEKEKVLLSTDNAVDRIPDSLKVFSTAIGREVHGRGGVVPDITVVVDSLNSFQKSLLRQSMIFNYAVNFANTHTQTEETSLVTPGMIEDFKAYLEKHKFSYESESQNEFEDFVTVLKKEGKFYNLEPQITAIQAVLNQSFHDTFSQNREFIKKQLELELATKQGGSSAKIRAGFKNDRALKAALKLIQNVPEFTALLQPDDKI